MYSYAESGQVGRQAGSRQAGFYLSDSPKIFVRSFASIPLSCKSTIKNIFILMKIKKMDT
jgi:hypothetical protein